MPTEAPATAAESRPSRGFVARMFDEARRVPPVWWALAFSVALCLPRLGGFGFWDPSELKIADQAREIERSGHLTDPTAGAGHYPAAKPLGPFLAALGHGDCWAQGELARGCSVALAALAALMAVYWAGAGAVPPARRAAGRRWCWAAW